MNKLVFNSPNLFSSGLKKDEWLSPFDKMLDEMLSASNPELHKVFGDSVFEKSAYPKVNIIDTSDSILIEASVPGAKKEDVSVEIEGSLLTIASRNGRDIKEDHSDVKFLKREIKKSSFIRTFTLSKDLDTSSVTADLDLGLLTIKIKKLTPKKNLIERKKIAIN